MAKIVDTFASGGTKSVSPRRLTASERRQIKALVDPNWALDFIAVTAEALAKRAWTSFNLNFVQVNDPDFGPSLHATMEADGGTHEFHIVNDGKWLKTYHTEPPDPQGKKPRPMPQVVKELVMSIGRDAQAAYKSLEGRINTWVQQHVMHANTPTNEDKNRTFQDVSPTKDESSGLELGPSHTNYQQGVEREPARDVPIGPQTPSGLHLDQKKPQAYGTPGAAPGAAGPASGLGLQHKYDPATGKRTTRGPVSASLRRAGMSAALRTVSAPIELEGRMLMVRAAFNSSYGQPNKLDMDHYVDTNFPGMRVREASFGKSVVTLVLKEGTANPKMPSKQADDGQPAGTANNPIDGQRDSLSSTEIEGTGKIAAEYAGPKSDDGWKTSYEEGEIPQRWNGLVLTDKEPLRLPNGFTDDKTGKLVYKDLNTGVKVIMTRNVEMYGDHWRRDNQGKPQKWKHVWNVVVFGANGDRLVDTKYSGHTSPPMGRIFNPHNEKLSAPIAQAIADAKMTKEDKQTQKVERALRPIPRAKNKDLVNDIGSHATLPLEHRSPGADGTVDMSDDIRIDSLNSYGNSVPRPDANLDTRLKVRQMMKEVESIEARADALSARLSNSPNLKDTGDHEVQTARARIHDQVEKLHQKSRNLRSRIDGILESMEVERPPNDTKYQTDIGELRFERKSGFITMAQAAPPGGAPQGPPPDQDPGPVDNLQDPQAMPPTGAPGGPDPRLQNQGPPEGDMQSEVAALEQKIQELTERLNSGEYTDADGLTLVPAPEARPSNDSPPVAPPQAAAAPVVAGKKTAAGEEPKWKQILERAEKRKQQLAQQDAARSKVVGVPPAPTPAPAPPVPPKSTLPPTFEPGPDRELTKPVRMSPWLERLQREKAKEEAATSKAREESGRDDKIQHTITNTPDQGTAKFLMELRQKREFQRQQSQGQAADRMLGPGKERRPVVDPETKLYKSPMTTSEYKRKQQESALRTRELTLELHNNDEKIEELKGMLAHTTGDAAKDRITKERVTAKIVELSERNHKINEAIEKMKEDLVHVIPEGMSNTEKSFGSASDMPREKSVRPTADMAQALAKYESKLNIGIPNEAMFEVMDQRMAPYDVSVLGGGDSGSKPHMNRDAPKALDHVMMRIYNKVQGEENRNQSKRYVWLLHKGENVLDNATGKNATIPYRDYVSYTEAPPLAWHAWDLLSAEELQEAARAMASVGTTADRMKNPMMRTSDRTAADAYDPTQDPNSPEYVKPDFDYAKLMADEAQYRHDKAVETNQSMLDMITETKEELTAGGMSMKEVYNLLKLSLDPDLYRKYKFFIEGDTAKPPSSEAAQKLLNMTLDEAMRAKGADPYDPYLAPKPQQVETKLTDIAPNIAEPTVLHPITKQDAPYVSDPGKEFVVKPVTVPGKGSRGVGVKPKVKPFEIKKRTVDAPMPAADLESVKAKVTNLEAVIQRTEKSLGVLHDRLRTDPALDVRLNKGVGLTQDQRDNLGAYVKKLEGKLEKKRREVSEQTAPISAEIAKLKKTPGNDNKAYELQQLVTQAVSKFENDPAVLKWTKDISDIEAKLNAGGAQEARQRIEQEIAKLEVSLSRDRQSLTRLKATEGMPQPEYVTPRDTANNLKRELDDEVKQEMARQKIREREELDAIPVTEDDGHEVEAVDENAKRYYKQYFPNGYGTALVRE